MAYVTANRCGKCKQMGDIKTACLSCACMILLSYQLTFYLLKSRRIMLRNVFVTAVDTVIEQSVAYMNAVPSSIMVALFIMAFEK